MNSGQNSQLQIDFSAGVRALELLRQALFDSEFATLLNTGAGRLEIRAEHASPWCLELHDDGSYILRAGEREQTRGALASGAQIDVCRRISELLGG